jgi:biopolymer transport protein TolQ
MPIAAFLAKTAMLAQTPAAASEFDIFDNLLASRGIVLGVLLVLATLSVVSWAIIVYKALWFSRSARASQRFLDRFAETTNPNELYRAISDRVDSPEGRVFVAGFKELGKLSNRSGAPPLTTGFENIERVVHRMELQEVVSMEKLLPFLATTGSAGPFIGLFGTVWGIMKAFMGLGAMEEQSNLLTTVTPHIAEALVATAIGLLAAIPAVMAYNFFVSRVRRLVSQLEAFGQDYLNVVRRLYFQ